MLSAVGHPAASGLQTGGDPAGNVLGEPAGGGVPVLGTRGPDLSAGHTPPCQEATATGPGRPDGQSSSKPRCSRSRPRGRCRRLLLNQAAGKTPLTVDRTLGRTHVPLDSTPALGSRPDQQPPEQDARQHPRVAVSASTGKVLLLPRLKPRRPLRCPRLPSAAAWGPAPVPFPRL